MTDARQAEDTQQYWTCKGCADVLIIGAGQPDECPVCEAPSEHLHRLTRVFKRC